MIRYRTLFQVDITHDYFLSRGDVVLEAQPGRARNALGTLYSVDQFLRIEPDAATREVLSGHRMLFRQTPGGFLVGVQLDPSAPDIRPAVPPVDGFSLSFTLRSTDGRFANYTELGAAESSFLRFSNGSMNRVVDSNFLSLRTAGFDALRRYVAGETRALANGPTFDLFVALRDTGPSATPVAADWRRIPADTFDAAATYQAGDVVLSVNRLFRALVDSPGADLTNAAQWQPAGVLANQYAGSLDAALLAGALFDLDLAAASLPQATIRIFRVGQTTPSSEQTFVASQGVLGRVQVDLRGLVPGRYDIEVFDGLLVPVAGAGGPIYLSPAARAEGWLGVIDIGLGTGAFALLNGDGTLSSVRYALRFLNRATRWRYVFPAAQAVGAGAEVALEVGSDRLLVTPSPRPLTRFGSGVRLQADVAATTTVSEEILLPLPEPNRIRRQNAEWFSETHLPNLTVGP
jgi:hypothetical protein